MTVAGGAEIVRDANTCSYLAEESTTIEIKDLIFDYSKIISGEVMGPFRRGARTFCHIQIRKPASDQTVQLVFTDFKAGRLDSSKTCAPGENQVIVTGTGVVLFCFGFIDLLNLIKLYCN